ncbi:CaiB/BaiF CoA transferase family protein [Nocardioides sp. B-3]|uniref:CaiB/BaiF CoA transferase family protein n=1 Tax=Nocardioides sp. B-3 TaxID=2895565 RepID=UPI003FA5BBCE
MTKLPLDGVRVLDLSTVLAAPLTASLLGEYGAEVIKVEHPVMGDPVRAYPPFVDDVSLHHKVTNRGKSSVTVDLSNDAGAELALELAGAVDVVVTNFRPATLRRWGPDYDDLRSRRTDPVVLHLTAFGREGPYADRPGFARIAEAYAGLTHITGYPDRPPVFAGYPLADGVVGMYAAFAVMLALRHRDETGEGQLIDPALFGTAAAHDGGPGGRCRHQRRGQAADGQPASKHLSQRPVPHRRRGPRDHPCLDPRMWQRLVTLIGDDDLRAYPTNAVRLKHRELIESRVAEWTQTYKRDDLLVLLEQNGVACGRVFTAVELLDDPHLKVPAETSSAFTTRNLVATSRSRRPFRRGRPSSPGSALPARARGPVPTTCSARCLERARRTSECSVN